MDDRQKLTKDVIAALESKFDTAKLLRFLESSPPPQWLRLEPTPQGVANYCFEFCEGYTSFPPETETTEKAHKRPGGILQASFSLIKKAQKISDVFGMQGGDPEPLSQEEVSATERIIKKAIRWYEEEEEMHLIYAREEAPVEAEAGRQSNQRRNELIDDLCKILLAAGLNQSQAAQYTKKLLDLYHIIGRTSKKSIENRISKLKII